LADGAGDLADRLHDPSGRLADRLADRADAAGDAAHGAPDRPESAADRAPDGPESAADRPPDTADDAARLGLGRSDRELVPAVHRPVEVEGERRGEGHGGNDAKELATRPHGYSSSVAPDAR